jgi:putative phosphoesterase
MRIGLIADTHIEHEHEDLPTEVYPALHGSDLILHAGDIYDPSVIDRLERIAPVLVVAGNGDEDRAVADARLQDAVVHEIAGWRIGLRHSIVYPEMGRYTIESEMTRCFGGAVDIVVVGDTHVELAEVCKGVLIVNPGSPTWPWQFRRLGTVGRITLAEHSAHVEIVALVDGSVPITLSHTRRPN